MRVYWRDDGDSLSLWIGRAMVARIAQFDGAVAYGAEVRYGAATRLMPGGGKAPPSKPQSPGQHPLRVALVPRPHRRIRAPRRLRLVVG